MTEDCYGVKAYNCPYGDFCKANSYTNISQCYNPKNKDDITNFFKDNKITEKSPLWVRGTGMRGNIYACEPKLEEKDLIQLLNEIDVLM
jgi:hypothetical protein